MITFESTIKKDINREEKYQVMKNLKENQKKNKMTQIQLLTGFISLILLLNTHSCEKTLSTSIGLSNNVQIQIVYTYRRDRTDFVVNSRLNGDFINNGWISFGLKNDQNFVIILKFYFFFVRNL